MTTYEIWVLIFLFLIFGSIHRLGTKVWETKKAIKEIKDQDIEITAYWMKKLRDEQNKDIDDCK